MATTKTMNKRLFQVAHLLTCGAIAPAFFIIVFLIEGGTRAGYNPLRQPISSLSIGELGWMQSANFIITGLLLLAFAFGLRFTLQPAGGTNWGPLLIGLVGIGLIGAGIYTTDPLNGYPAGTPLMPVVRSSHGRLHDLFGLPVFLGLPAACLIFCKDFLRQGKRGWAIYSALSGAGMFAAFVLAGLGFRQTPGFVDFAGVFQRLSLIIGLTWMTLLAAHYLHNTTRNTGKAG